MAVNIILPQIVLNTANRNSGVNIGENAQTNWHSNAKNNYGVGAQFGINFAVGNMNLIIDNDVIDGTMNEIDPSQTIQNQTL